MERQDQSTATQHIYFGFIFGKHGINRHKFWDNFTKLNFIVLTQSEYFFQAANEFDEKKCGKITHK